MTSDLTQAPGMAQGIPVRVHAIDQLAVQVIRLDLRPLDSAGFMAFEPGAHAMLHLGNGLARAYSLVNAADDQRYVIAVSLAPSSRGGSDFLHHGVQVGDTLTLETPRNHFPLREDAQHTVLVAGGIGITPILAMARRLTALKRSWELLYCARSRGHAAFAADMEQLAKQAHARADFHFDDERGGAQPNFAGLLDDVHEGTHFYCCGPQGFMDNFLLCAKRIPQERLHTESFTPVEAVADELGGFRVVLANSGQEFDVPPGMSILNVLRENGIDAAALCEEGTCGSCEVAVLEGQPVHRDHFLTPEDKEENATIMICCSSCSSPRLVIDL